MFVVEHMVTSFISAAAFGIIFNAPKQSLFKCGIVGMLGWMIYIVLFTVEIDTVIATLAASFVVAVVSQIFAKMYKTPVIIFSVAGIIPLVPAGLPMMP